MPAICSSERADGFEERADRADGRTKVDHDSTIPAHATSIPPGCGRGFGLWLQSVRSLGGSDRHVGRRPHCVDDCAHGDIPISLTVNARNEFDVSGTFVREHGGPIRVGEMLDSHPAAYLGSITETTMMLTVRLTDTNEAIGAFTLSRGSPGRLVKCLLPLARG